MHLSESLDEKKWEKKKMERHHEKGRLSMSENNYGDPITTETKKLHKIGN